MFDTFQGLPVHALVLHFTVVLLPLAAVLTAGLAFLPRRFAAYGWLVVLLDAGMVAITYVTVQSGEALLGRLGGPEAVSADVRKHAALGADMTWYALALLAAAVVIVLVRRSAPAALAGVVAVVAVLVAGAVVVQTIRAGHAGSTAVWAPVVEGTGG